MSFLTVPKEKKPRKGENRVLLQPLPVPIESLSGIPSSNHVWRWYTASLHDKYVFLQSNYEESLENIANMGYFGSYEPPQSKDDFLSLVEFDWKSPDELISNPQKRSLNEDSESQENESLETVNKLSRLSEENQSKSISTKWREFVSTTAETERILYLEFYEAFYLSYALGCLIIKNSEAKPLNIDELWSVFCSKNKYFAYYYFVYHHFRAKGWVVKNGLKFGCDFLLYKHGPPFYHASYSVIVVFNDNQKDLLDWNYLAGLNRITESAAKELLLVQIQKPQDEFEVIHPKHLNELALNEILLKRWVPTHERISVDKECFK